MIRIPRVVLAHVRPDQRAAPGQLGEALDRRARWRPASARISEASTASPAEHSRSSRTRSRRIIGGRRPLPTADGYAAILPYSPEQWTSLFRRIGRADVLAHHDLTDRHRVNAVVRLLYDELHGEGPSRTTAQWMDICDELDLPATSVYALDDLPSHPHLKAVGLFQNMEHPSEGALRYVRPAVRFGTTPASVRVPAPLLGQDTEVVLAGLGYSSTEIAALASAGVIATTRAAEAT